MLSRIRAAVVLSSLVFALPVTCGQQGDGVYSGGIEPSPSSRINPAEPGFTNGH